MSYFQLDRNRATSHKGPVMIFFFILLVHFTLSQNVSFYWKHLRALFTKVVLHLFSITWLLSFSVDIAYYIFHGICIYIGFHSETAYTIFSWSKKLAPKCFCGWALHLTAVWGMGSSNLTSSFHISSPLIWGGHVLQLEITMYYTSRNTEWFRNIICMPEAKCIQQFDLLSLQDLLVQFCHFGSNCYWWYISRYFSKLYIL